MKIGVAGLGKMGTAITKRLIDVGHDVSVWNRSPEKGQAADCSRRYSNVQPTAQTAQVETVSFHLPLAERTLAVYDQASGEGWGGRDWTELPAYWSGRKR